MKVNNFEIKRQKPANMPMALLLQADPSVEQIQKYLPESHCFTANLSDKVVAVLVLLPENRETLEIKNIAVTPEWQRKGIGTQLLKFTEDFATENGYRQLIIGTGNSSINQLELYQKAGFGIFETRHDYFIKNYPEPIIENGMQCKHMILLKKEIK